MQTATDPQALSTGLPGLDTVLQGLIAGDNLVWQVETIEDVLPFVTPYCAHARAHGNQVVYFRFADHPPLVEPADDVLTCELHPEVSFESFIAEIHKVIGRVGAAGRFVFDSLSELVVDWSSDRMVGNFFMLTCPYVLAHKGLALFPLLREQHSTHATTPISETAQIVIDVYRHPDAIILHPLKVEHRHSPTLYMPHVWEGETFRPVTDSVTVTEILRDVPWTRSDGAGRRPGFWNEAFARAEQLQATRARGGLTPEEERETKDRLLRMAVARSGRMLELASRFLKLSDLLAIRRRMIGTGLIGGKSVGMLVARAILREQHPALKATLEPHDSFFIGADVFYTYLVENDIWWLKQKQKEQEQDAYLAEAETARQKILGGAFPDYIMESFQDMLDYFGQSPIIVRSSSLLEDGFGNAFAGKYESVFCVNQGSPAKRLEQFTDAVRRIYASTMSEAALRYRAQRGLLQRDEQMALLVQRVSGARYDRYHLPQAAGVGLSFNPYAWSPSIDPHAGVLRLVFGLGTRAVDRADDDYTRVVALNAPSRRPDHGSASIRAHAQHRVDLLDLEADTHASEDFTTVARSCKALPFDWFVSRDPELERLRRQRDRRDIVPWVLTFDRLLRDSAFPEEMREILSALEATYSHPVDIEFTLNFLDDGTHRINLLQCRPLQVREGGRVPDPPAHVEDADCLLRSTGPVIGRSRELAVDRVLYVVPTAYARCTMKERYALARVLGRINRLLDRKRHQGVLLLGPGRWCTTTPALGVPTHFSEIDRVHAIIEIVTDAGSTVPDVSLGTHFFNELVEADILYLALTPDGEHGWIHEALLEAAPNRLSQLLPNDAGWSEVLRVIDPREATPPLAFTLNASAPQQRVVCYQEGDGG